jgi:hypothetical protein
VTAARAGDGTTTPLLQVPPGVFLSPGQAQRVTLFALTLQLTAGRSVPIQVVERITAWLYDGRNVP